jgi:DNA repair protein RecN (Recombination protein N)
MLVELRIRDYAVVEDLTLRLSEGLNALTGETGAGKSIVVGALSLLLGERASSDVVRAGAERASVEAVFDVEGVASVRRKLDDYGLRLEDGLLILRREVAVEGRNRAWVGGSPTTAGIVGDLGSALVDLHGQHEHQTLLRPRHQRDILDAFAGAVDVAAEVGELHQTRLALLRDHESREERRRDVESRADFLRFQLSEIDGARPKPGEDDDLTSEAGRLEHGEELARGAAELHAALYGEDDAVADRLATLRRALERLASFDQDLRVDAERLSEAWYIVDDVGRRVGDYAATIDHDPERLEAVRARADRLMRLKRKYGPELADVLATAQRVRSELSALDDADHDLEELRTRIREVEQRLATAAGDLSGLRRSAAGALASAVEAVLPTLGMPGARFEVRLVAHDAISASGAESVEFLVTLNEGFDAQPLARVASGGELSRVMLALKSVLADVDGVPILVFDEIDAGIGGTVATAVGEKLSEVARRHQVLVVTHLAQVASRARSHLLVEKGSGQGRTVTSVRELDGEARVAEVARMLGGDPESEVSRRHARELLGAR